MNSKQAAGNIKLEKSIKDKTAVITGASKGIGRAIALAFATEGANLALAARSEKELLKVKKEAEGKGAKVLAFATDVSDEKDVVSFAKKTASEFKRVDFLINCAGQFLEKDFFDTKIADWERIVGTNLKGTYLCAREFGKIMKSAKSGVIINFSSVGGRIGLKRKVVYCSSKFGVAGLSKALSKELKPYNIKVHVIYPYMVDSKNEVDWKDEEKILNVLKVEDVAEFVLMLAKLPLRVEIEDIYLDTFLK